MQQNVDWLTSWKYPHSSIYGHNKLYHQGVNRRYKSGSKLVSQNMPRNLEAKFDPIIPL